MTNLNQRSFLREDTDNTIQVMLVETNFESLAGDSDFISAKIVNQSDNGLKIESERYLEPGSNIRIKMAFDDDSGLEEAYYVRDGRVVWCQKTDSSPFRFKAGINILRKVIQGNIATSRFR